MFAFVNQGQPDAGFFDNTIPDNVSYNFNSALSTYGLTTPIGPLTGTEQLITGVNSRQLTGT